MEDEILDFFYKWHRLEKRNGTDIIDFDLIRQGNNFPGKFKDREEAKERLTQLLQNYKNYPKNRFIESKLRAAIYYLRALMGEIIPFEEYVENTMGIKPRVIPEEFLKKQLSLVKEAFSKLGYKYPDDGEKFLMDNAIDKKEIETGFGDFKDDILPKFVSWLNLKIPIKYNIRFVDVDEYWRNWISTDETGKMMLIFNTNKRHKWVRGLTEYQVFHEICGHVVQAISWKRELEKTKMNPVAGLTACFSAEMFALEGIAQTLYYFYPESPFSELGLSSLLIDHLDWMVWNNAHIMANSGSSADEILEFVRTYFPYYEKEELGKKIEEKVKDPLGRTYQYIYGISTYYFRQIADKLSPEGKRGFVLDIYSNAYTPKELMQKYGAKPLP